MSQIKTLTNRRIVLASRPKGAPVKKNFRTEKAPIPPLGPGQMLLRTIYLSLDPYMRGRMSEGPSYAPPVSIGDVMVGGTVSRIEASRHPDYSEGDWVLGNTGWQEYAISDGDGLTPLDPDHAPPSYALGLLGMTGFTAYMGLLDIGRPKAGETVVVAAATGAVGSVVGQIAKLKGCRAVGIAGRPDKCRYAVEELGFDECIDHRSPGFKSGLAAAVPNGIDVYFESVGGDVFKAVVPLLNDHARVPLCGLIAHYNATSPPRGPDRTPSLMRTLLTRRIKIQGFIIFDDYGSRYHEFAEQMGKWLVAGKLKYREDMVDGLDNAPGAFIGLLEGKNFGKLVVRVSAD